MADSQKENLIRNITMNATIPLVFHKFVNNWPMRHWDVEKWCSVFGERELPFRCLKRDFRSDEPCWERRCNTKKMSFKKFVDSIEASSEWMYFDYKYVHQWFDADSELSKEMSWKLFGYDKGAVDTTIWVGTDGSHTPAHQDTYGYNIFAQVHGRKRWILFPPDTAGLKPTRVPYEESSVYSELNFYCPQSLDVFAGLTGGRMVELSAGDALLVPRGWWHYVQNIDALNISLNMWLPHEKDPSAHVSEALIKIFIGQVCKDLPIETARMVVNPNEFDIADTPLAVLFLQLETVANTYIDKKRRALRLKRLKTREEPQVPDDEEFDLTAVLEDPENNIQYVPNVTSDDLVKVVKTNLTKYANVDRLPDDDEVEGSSSLCLTKAVIDAFCQADVIELVKQNLLAKLS
ncbi:unnamed protein product [Leptidea sinapis]|uniref:JmjC domain-containing protein n=1 Tax=Leptidea sinapis TaxID=189913 RepID=A0A5E4PU98_9NEOP|nr:unnamed protein product [Leptidea sinapis]